MIDEHSIAKLHFVAHEVAGLIVPHTAPASGLLGSLGQVVNREAIGLGLHQPAFLRCGHGTVTITAWRRFHPKERHMFGIGFAELIILGILGLMCLGSVVAVG